MTDPQVPRIPDLLAPGIDALVEGLSDSAREARIRHANHGRYGDILRGLAGQATVVRARFTREIIATRLIEANGGQPLRDLAASEYFATLADEPQYAIGEMYLTRTKINASAASTGNFLAGVIPKGSRLNRPKTTGDIPLADADFLTTEDVAAGADDTSAPVSAGGGQWTHTQTVVVPIIAARPGPDSNTERENVLGAIPSRLFDAALPSTERFQPGYLYSAGGLVSVSDAQLLDFARAMGPGFNGANTSAAHAGCRADPRVRRVASALNYETAILRLYIADASWATSKRFRDTIRQGLFDNKWIGFGGRVDVGQVYNVPITVAATVYLRDRKYDSERSAITRAIREKLTGYFDNRADFYTWRRNAIGGVVATADYRVQTCASVQVLSAGAALAEPPSKISGGALSVPHYSLRALSLTFKSLGS